MGKWGKNEKDTFVQGYVDSMDIFGTFDSADVPQRPINQSLYQDIILVQKFNYIGGRPN